MLAVGDTAPHFSLPALSGEQMSLAELAVSGPVLLAFFKVSCPTCQYAFPFLERLATADRLRITGISQDDAKATAQFCNTYGISFPVALDHASARYPASNAYRISHVPSLFLVEGSKITHAFSGFSKFDLEQLGQRFGILPLFRRGEKIPEFRPG